MPSMNPSPWSSLPWCQRRVTVWSTGGGGGGSLRVPSVPPSPTWCWCCGSARTERCCCWCSGCGDSCWAWPRTSCCPHRWDSRAGARCPHTPGCLPAGRRTASSDRERPGSSRRRRTAEEETGRGARRQVSGKHSTWTSKVDWNIICKTWSVNYFCLFALRQMFSNKYIFLNATKPNVF